MVPHACLGYGRDLHQYLLFALGPGLIANGEAVFIGYGVTRDFLAARGYRYDGQMCAQVAAAAGVGAAVDGAWLQLGLGGLLQVLVVSVVVGSAVQSMEHQGRNDNAYRCGDHDPRPTSHGR